MRGLSKVVDKVRPISFREPALPLLSGTGNEVPPNKGNAGSGNEIEVHRDGGDFMVRALQHVRFVSAARKNLKNILRQLTVLIRFPNHFY